MDETKGMTVREWKGKAEKHKRQLEFENQLGVDLYNLDTSILDTFLAGHSIETKRKKGMLDNIIHFFPKALIDQPDRLKALDITTPDSSEISVEDWMTQATEQLEQKIRSISESQTMRFLTILRQEQAEYRRLVDNGINREKPTDDECLFIQSRIRRITAVIWAGDDNGGALMETSSIGIDGILGHSYRFLCRLWNGKVQMGRCAAEDCDNIFVPYRPGKKQRFCSDRCYKRTYMRERRRQNAEDVV